MSFRDFVRVAWLPVQRELVIEYSIGAGFYDVALRLRFFALDPSPRPPLPHAEHGFLRQPMTHLPGQHADLPTAVRIMRDQICEESRYIRLESLHPAVRHERFLEYGAQSRAALVQSLDSLRGSDA